MRKTESKVIMLPNLTHSSPGLVAKPSARQDATPQQGLQGSETRWQFVSIKTHDTGILCSEVSYHLWLWGLGFLSASFPPSN